MKSLCIMPMISRCGHGKFQVNEREKARKTANHQLVWTWRNVFIEFILPRIDMREKSYSLRLCCCWQPEPIIPLLPWRLLAVAIGETTREKRTMKHPLIDSEFHDFTCHFFFTRRCRCVGRSLLVTNLLEVFKVQIFPNVMVYPQKKLWGKKTSLICSRSTNEIFSELLLRKNKNGEIKQCSQPPSSRINILRDYVTFFLNRRHQKCQ